MTKPRKGERRPKLELLHEVLEAAVAWTIARRGYLHGHKYWEACTRLDAALTAYCKRYRPELSAKLNGVLPPKAVQREREAEPEHGDAVALGERIAERHEDSAE